MILRNKFTGKRCCERPNLDLEFSVPAHFCPVTYPKQSQDFVLVLRNVLWWSHIWLLFTKRLGNSKNTCYSNHAFFVDWENRCWGFLLIYFGQPLEMGMNYSVSFVIKANQSWECRQRNESIDGTRPRSLVKIPNRYRSKLLLTLLLEVTFQNKKPEEYGGWKVQKTCQCLRSILSLVINIETLRFNWIFIFALKAGIIQFNYKNNFLGDSIHFFKDCDSVSFLFDKLSSSECNNSRVDTLHAAGFKVN